jgi:hypothetical protein
MEISGSLGGIGGAMRWVDVTFTERIIGRSKVLSFADESRTNTGRIDDLEVLAAVTQGMCPPEPVHLDREFKYGYYEVLVRRRDRTRLQSWDAALRGAQVFIYDSRPAIEALRLSPHYGHLLRACNRDAAEEWLADQLLWETCLLDPYVWMHGKYLCDEWTDWAVPDWGRLRDAILARVDGGNLVNVRRRTLRSQALATGMLDYRPPMTAFDMRGRKTINLEMPVEEFVLAITPQVVYDCGHTSDIAGFDAARRDARSLLCDYEMSRALPPFVPGEIAEVPSHKDPHVQLADVAAGRARDMYMGRGGREAVGRFFSEAFVNGVRISETDGGLEDGERRLRSRAA